MNETEMQRYAQVASLLIDIECSMRNNGLWSEQCPNEEAMKSQEPFCVDTLDFHQWLQFVFIERLTVMVKQNQPLPKVSGVAPMAEELFKANLKSLAVLINQLREIDELLNCK